MCIGATRKMAHPAVCIFPLLVGWGTRSCKLRVALSVPPPTRACLCCCCGGRSTNIATASRLCAHAAMPPSVTLCLTERSQSTCRVRVAAWLVSPMSHAQRGAAAPPSRRLCPSSSNAASSHHAAMSQSCRAAGKKNPPLALPVRILRCQKRITALETVEAGTPGPIYSCATRRNRARK